MELSISTTPSTRPLRATERAARASRLAPAIAIAALLCSLALAPVARASEKELLQLFVAEPYLDLRTGPGRGYPVTQVVARGEAVDVLYARTDYFKGATCI